MRRKIKISKQRFKNACKARHTNMKKIVEEIGGSYDTVRYCIQHEEIMPDTLEEISKCLNVHPDYLEGKEMEKAEDPETWREYPENKEIPASDLDDAISWYKNQIDSEGMLIPDYHKKSIHNRYERKKDLLLDYLSEDSNPLFMNKTRSYFEKHYEDIQDLITFTIHAYIVKHKEE